MSRNIIPVVYLVVMVAVVVAVDILIFRHQAWERLVANVIIVLLFAVAYFIFLKHS